MLKWSIASNRTYSTFLLKSFNLNSASSASLWTSVADGRSVAQEPIANKHSDTLQKEDGEDVKLRGYKSIAGERLFYRVCVQPTGGVSPPYPRTLHTSSVNKCQEPVHARHRRFICVSEHTVNTSPNNDGGLGSCSGVTGVILHHTIALASSCFRSDLSIRLKS